MYIEFENWLVKQEISLTAREIFQEAFTCYRVSAYKSAFILSYLAFQLALRDRILKSTKPNEVSDKLWDWVRSNLVSRKPWDNEIFDVIQGKIPNIINLSQDLKNQITYWNNRWDECINASGTTINYSLVESFWFFIRLNLAKIVVSGGKDELMNAIRDHFNLGHAALGQDIDPIIEQIFDSVDPDETLGFFQEVYELFLKEESLYSQVQTKNAIEFFNALFKINDLKFIMKLIQFLIANENFLVGLLRTYPDKIIYFGSLKKFIRRLWSSKLFEPAGTNDFALYCSLLRNSLIPDEELHDAQKHIITSRLHGALPDEDCLQVMKMNGFFTIFKEVAFIEGYLMDKEWGTENADLIIYYLDEYGLDLLTARELERVFSIQEHPEQLRNKLNSYLLTTFEKRKEMAQFFVNNQIVGPRYLTPLKTAIDVIINDA